MFTQHSIVYHITISKFYSKFNTKTSRKPYLVVIIGLEVIKIRQPWMTFSRLSGNVKITSFIFYYCYFIIILILLPPPSLFLTKLAYLANSSHCFCRLSQNAPSSSAGFAECVANSSAHLSDRDPVCCKINKHTSVTLVVGIYKQVLIVMSDQVTFPVKR